MPKKWQQHGDVQLIPIDKIPDSALSIGNRTIVQEGEITGHAHRMSFPVPMFREPVSGELFMEVPKAMDISHETHNPQPVSSETFQVDRVVEYDYDREELRMVAD